MGWDYSLFDAVIDFTFGGFGALPILKRTLLAGELYLIQLFNNKIEPEKRRFKTKGCKKSIRIELIFGFQLDTLNFNVSYNLYYFSDAGLSWVLLISGSSEAKYVWNTKTVIDGSNYILNCILLHAEWKFFAFFFENVKFNNFFLEMAFIILYTIILFLYLLTFYIIELLIKNNLYSKLVNIIIISSYLYTSRNSAGRK